MNRKLRDLFSILVVTMLLLQISFIQVEMVDADTHSSNDVEPVEAFNTEQNSLLNTVSARENLENNREKIQEFLFDVKSFRTVIGQPTTFRFTSKLPSNEVLIRIPENAKIIENQFSNGESIQHSHGEYWILRTKGEQKSFKVSVLFEIPGNYFLTLDDDADHVYVEVQDSPSVIGAEKQNELEEAEISNQSEEMTEKSNSTTIQPIIAVEENLSIPEELIIIEEERILEETRDTQNRSTSYVNNWNQFRSAWNNSSVTEISLIANVNFSSSILGSSLDVRRTAVMITGGTSRQLNVGTSGNSLLIDGNGTILNIRTPILSENSGTQPLVGASRGAVVRMDAYGVVMNRRASAAVSLDNSTGFFVGSAVHNQQARSPITLTNSELTLQGSGLQIGSTGNSSTFTPPISSNASSNIYISGNNFLMAGRFDLSLTTNGIFSVSFHNPLESWNMVNVHLSGNNGEVINSATSSPDEFSIRYLPIHNTVAYRSFKIGSSTSDGFNPPPAPSYRLSLHANPEEAGSPSAEKETIEAGTSTIINANSKKEFQFLRWEIVSGNGSSISDENSEISTFTMGSSDTIVEAIYESKQAGVITVEYVDEEFNRIAETDQLNGLVGEEYETTPKEIPGYTLKEIPENASGIFLEEEQTVSYIYEREEVEPVSPVDPLAPEVEVNPENTPELPENQGLLSIDFVSSFNFGSQAISVHDQTYYAQPQRLLNEDGAVNENEVRPNYVQISDRRPESERNGWELAVTQKEQFKGKENQVLNGASITLSNQQVVTAQGGTEPGLQFTVPCGLVPGNRRTLLKAQGNEGTGTWIYRFGDSETAGESVSLYVPKGTNPEATSYSTTLTWELSAVPDN
ncbi:WxL domain-containing protein [Enterococcus sp. DIV0765f]|uniref:WxL domain-containing protein n=1 Tax=Enterococcus sp. DIV0765f TaxID=2774783 RepID=UPI003F6840D8